MHGLSTVDGFVEINECLAEMIKYLANEPSVGLYYVQQHTQNAVPNVVSLKNNVEAKSRETTLHTEDLEDSITMVRSMKDCGLPIADEMIKDIKKSLVIMSSKEPKRGLIRNPSPGFQMGRASSWGPVTWGRNTVSSQQEGEAKGGYFSTVLKSAKEKATNFKWSQPDLKERRQGKSEMLQYPSSSNLVGMEADELPLSSPVADESQDEVPVDGSLGSRNLLSGLEDYDEFRADREAKLKEWLEGTRKDAEGV